MKSMHACSGGKEKGKEDCEMAVIKQESRRSFICCELVEIDYGGCRPSRKAVACAYGGGCLCHL